MAFRRPGNWSNGPSAGPPRGYFAPQNAQLSPPSNDGYYDDPIEEEIDEYAVSNEYAYRQEYYSGEPVEEFCEDAFGQDDQFQYDQPEGGYGKVDDHDVFYPEQAGYSIPDSRYNNTTAMHSSAHQSRMHSSSQYSTNSSSSNSRTATSNKIFRSDGRNTTALKPVSLLPDIYRGVFKRFGVFNAVQSACFDDIMKTNENLVISAPTGSGKTVLFELAMLRMQMQGSGKDAKCVYIAPTKALCTEKFTEWSAKFEPLGMKCCELTGDTVFGSRGLWTEAKNASIIVTTGEKWDSITRSWNDHQDILSHIALFLVDEVHVLGESRGSTLEVVVSRMKMRGSAIRFVLVSATIPNIDDVAAWIAGKDRSSAKILQFGEEYRPCKLTRHVVGISRRRDCHDFGFAKVLDANLYRVILEHSVGKPILIFVSTRKGVFSTAEVLAKAYKEGEGKRAKMPWSRPSRIDTFFNDQRLAELAAVGIGVHHAGLDAQDRKTIEQLYIQKKISVLVATSTLAVGVNLPAHFVIVKGVQLYQNGASIEYSDLDIMQMMGRAGRPQYDTEGIAVIMCEHELVAKYQALSQGTKVLESCLHHNLSEHINSEIGMGTITDVESAKRWLRDSFLYQRLRKNPNHYAIEDQQSSNWQDRMDEIVLASIRKLQDHELVKQSGSNTKKALATTEYGEIMSKLYIRQATMVEFLSVQKNTTLRELLELICRSEEFMENKIRQSEKAICNELRKHPEIRFAIKKVENTADKVFVIIQAVLGGISLNAPEYKGPDCQLYLEAFSIFRHVNRLARAVVEIGIVRKDGKQIKNGLELVRCSAAKAWEDRPVVLRQIENLGEKSIKILVENGVTTLNELRSQNPLRIDALLQRKFGFGHEIVALASAMPRYDLRVEETGVYESKENGVEVEISITCGLANTGQEGIKRKDKKLSRKVIDMTSVLTISSDYELIDFRRTNNKAFKTTKLFNVSAHLTKPSQSVIVIVSPESFAGCAVQVDYKPKIPVSLFPVRQTRPPTSIENDLEGLEDVPDFWQMGFSEGSDDQVKAEPDLPKPVAAVTAPQSKKQDFGMVQPRQLPNGNYECNHPCNDKTKCRHYCCKHGLPAAPKKPKEKAPNSIMSDDHKEVKKTGSSVQRLHKKSLANDEKKLNDLQKHHDNASVSQSLGLPTGQRLKLERTITVPTATSKKPKQPANYELSFTDLGESSMLSSGMLLDDAELDCDDDEPPESVAQYLALEKKLASVRKPKATLKRNTSIISLGTDDEEDARPSVPKRSRREPSSPVTLVEDQRDEAPLFFAASTSSGPGDYGVDDVQAPGSPTLMDDIGKFLGFDDCDLTAAEAEEPPTDWKTATVTVSENLEAYLNTANTNQNAPAPTEDAGNTATNEFYDFLDDLGAWLDEQVEESEEMV